MLQSLKARVDRFITMVKEFIQKIGSIITKKLSKIFKTDTIMVSQRYYNTAMNLIREIENIAPNPIEKFKLDTTLFTGNQEYAEKVYEELNHQYDNLNERVKNLPVVQPEEGDKIIVIRTDKLRKMIKQYTVMVDNSKKYLVMLNQSSAILSKKLDVPVEEVAPAISSLCKAASLTILKGNSLLVLTNNLLRSGYRSEEEMKLSEHDKTHQFAVESMLYFCDEMMITEESLRRKDIRQSSKSATNDIDKYNKEIIEMPESTGEEIENKLEKIKEIRDIVGDTIDSLKGMTPDALDKFINAIAKIGNVAVTAGTMYFSARNSITNLLGVTPKSVHKKTMVILCATKLMKNATFKKAYISNKNKAREMFIQELTKVDNKYKVLEDTLKTKLA